MLLRRAIHSAIGLGVMGAVAIACNSISGLDADYELESDASATNPIDGTTSSSSGATDGAGQPDRVSSDDGGPPLVDAGPFSCATAPTNLFCSDFEGPAADSSPFGWDGTVIEGEPSGPKVEANAGRTGRGLHVSVTGAPTSHNNGLVKTITFTPPEWQQGRSLTLRFAFKVTSAGTYAAIGIIEFLNREHGLSVYPSGDPNACAAPASPCVDENDQEQRGHDESSSRTLALDVWHDAVVTLRKLPTNTYGSTITVDGVAVDERANGAMPQGSTASVTVSVGARYSGVSGTTDVYIDDVLVTLQ